MDAMPKADAVAFFSRLFRGAHHIPGCYHGGADNVKPWGHGWCVITHGGLATWDDNALTRLVFAAHDACYRAEVSTAGMRLRIAIHPREAGTSSIMFGHPTLDEAVARWRSA